MRINLPVLFLFSFCIYLLIAGCSKSQSNTNPVIPPPVDTIPNKPDTTEDVYIVGKKGNHGGYWKNSQFIPLDLSSKSSYAGDMAFSGNDIYVSGTIGNSIGYWKNGLFTVVSATGGDSLTPTAMALINQDVYTLMQLQLPVWNGYLYKNNTVSLPLSTTNEPGLTNMYVNGTDLYIPGTDMHIPSNPVYWKNGVPVTLPNSGNSAFAYGVTLDGADLHVVGKTFNSKAGTFLATWWKNGNPSFLTDTNSFASAEFITAAGGTIYIAGTMHPGNQAHNTDTLSAMLWKNGVATKLTTSGYADRVTGMAVNGSSVYISVTTKSLNSGTYIYRYYKNGTVINLTGIPGEYGTRIFVRPR